MPLSMITMVTPVPSAPHGVKAGARPFAWEMRRSPHGLGVFGSAGAPSGMLTTAPIMSGSTRATNGCARTAAASAGFMDAANPMTACS